jgi:formamidopyrimidine-DNA glycosylase
VPELPEVETTVRDLRPLVAGRHIRSVAVSPHALRRPWSPEWVPLLVGRRIRAVQRRGKWIILDLDRDLFLVFHLGMTGRLTAMPARREPEPHTHIVLGLDGGRRQLRFADIRRFGSASLFAGREALELFFTESGLGPEPFDLDPDYWRRRLAATDRSLKAVLLDQRVVAGVGNIYADEALFEARLHPTRIARTLTEAEADRLRRAIVTVLNQAIKLRGTTIRNYVGGSGLKGLYQEKKRIYGRTGKPCVRCGTPVERIRLAQRSTHFCPQCQPAIEWNARPLTRRR